MAHRKPTPKRPPAAKPKAAPPPRKPAPPARKAAPLQSDRGFSCKVIVPKASAAKPLLPEPPKRGRGKPVYVPTEQDGAWVRNLVAGGVLEDRIASMLGIAATTLRRHYKDAIRVGQSKIDAISINTLLTAMQNGGKEGVTAAIWWQKARMGWVEKVIVDDGKPADTPMRVIVQLMGDAPADAAGAGQHKPRSGFDAGKHVQLVG